MVGLSITYALSLTGVLTWLVRTATNAENSMVSVERVLNLCALDSEAPQEIPENRPPKDWPSKGKIRFENVKMRYRPGLDLVLKGKQCDIFHSNLLTIIHFSCSKFE